VWPQGAVCELGGGMTCLAGLMVAICADVREVLLSDGNEKSHSEYPFIIFSPLFFPLSLIPPTHTYLYSADTKLWCLCRVVCLQGCLFLDQYRASLVDAIRRLLRPNGMALVFAPLRGETLRLFCQLAQQAGLCASQHQQYDAQVWDVHLKNDLKFPSLTIS
uniref:Calmodulin-lysine N-methyltransferase n=1 Tax=Cyclopterus lumpus TaxID=8103 RepID=A0A8C3AWA8_CYCLU